MRVSEDGCAPGRGQLVLVAAVVVAVALVPIVFAYLQLGYHADVRAGGEYDDPTADATATLDRALHAAVATHSTENWSRRAAVVDGLRDRLDERVETVETARLDEGIARTVRFNGTATQQWAADGCPDGRGRAFGDCRAIDGVVVQDRAGDTVVLGIVVDVRVTTERGWTNTTVRLPTPAGRAATG